MSRAKSKQPQVFITDKDFEILNFLWRWKAISSQALANKFYPNARPHSAYCRLIRLEKFGMIRALSFRHRKGFAWVLDKKGFQYLVPYLPELSQNGYKTENFLHDFYASAFHLGEWLLNQPDGCAMCSEQELRRLPPDLLPPWVPKPLSHRPDGYSLVKRDRRSQVFAFEIELTGKSKHRYEDTLDFYESELAIHAGIWLVGTPYIHRLINTILVEQNLPRRQMHHFILLSDFKKRGWLTPLQGGVFNDQSLADILCDSTLTLPLLKPDYSLCAGLLENWKRPINSNRSKSAAAAAASD